MIKINGVMNSGRLSYQIRKSGYFSCTRLEFHSFQDSLPRAMELCKQWGVEYEKFLELKNWFKNQNHLPQNTPDEYFVVTIHSCYSDIQSSKKTIEAYFRIKTASPQIFAGRSLDSKAIQQAHEVAPVVILPKVTEEGYSVVLAWFADRTPTKFIVDDILKFMFMVVDVIALDNPGTPGIIFLYDVTGFSFKHFFRTPISSGRKYLEYIQDACPIRVKGIHMLNVGAALSTLLNLAKPFIHTEYINKINMYSNRDFEVLLKNTKITLDMVPKELGGQGPSAQNILDETLKRVARYKGWFKFDETLRITDKK